jgi:hypothetical protein
MQRLFKIADDITERFNKQKVGYDARKVLDAFINRKIKINKQQGKDNYLSGSQNALTGTLNKHPGLYNLCDTVYDYAGGAVINTQDDIVCEYTDFYDKNGLVNIKLDSKRILRNSLDNGLESQIFGNYIQELYYNQFRNNDMVVFLVWPDIDRFGFNTISNNNPKSHDKFYTTMFKLLSNQRNFVIAGSSAVYLLTDVKFQPNDIDLFDESDHKVPFSNYIINTFIPNLKSINEYDCHSFTSTSRCVITTKSGITIDIYRPNGGAYLNIANYHFSAVKLGIKCDNNGEYTEFAYPSAILSYSCGPSIIDIRNIFTKKNPFELLYKYEKRGFKIALNNDIITMYNTYKKLMQYESIDVKDEKPNEKDEKPNEKEPAKVEKLNEKDEKPNEKEPAKVEKPNEKEQPVKVEKLNEKEQPAKVEKPNEKEQSVKVEKPNEKEHTKEETKIPIPVQQEVTNNNIIFVNNVYTKHMLNKHNIVLCLDSNGVIYEYNLNDSYDPKLHAHIVLDICGYGTMNEPLVEKFMNYNNDKCSISIKVDKTKKFIELIK